MKKLLRKLILWALSGDKTFLLRKELYEVGTVGVDVHTYMNPSWAVINLHGEKRSYLKFIDLKDADVLEIAQFLRQFERKEGINIDAHPAVLLELESLGI